MLRLIFFRYQQFSVSRFVFATDTVIVHYFFIAFYNMLKIYTSIPVTVPILKKMEILIS